MKKKAKKKSKGYWACIARTRFDAEIFAARLGCAAGGGHMRAETVRGRD
jgi:hypothetical protein